MQFKYSKLSSEPTVPILDILVSSAFNKSRPEKGKIDTGSAMTAIPDYLVKVLELEETGDTVMVYGFNDDGQTSEEYPTYHVHITIDGIKFELLEVIARKRETVLLGRDIINLWEMNLDGKNCIGDINPWSTNPADVVY